MGAESFGEQWWEVYDATHGRRPLPDAAVDRIVGLCGRLGGLVLDLGAGTGRLSLPLADRNLHVTAVDASPSMLTALQGKSDGGGDRIDLQCQDFSSLDLQRRDHDVAIFSYNSLLYVEEPELQLRSLQNAGTHVHSDGRVIVEIDLPSNEDIAKSSHVVADADFGGGPALAITKHDLLKQRVYTSVVRLDTQETRAFSMRYIWPNELCLMAKCAGLTVEKLFSNWEGDTWDGHETLIAILSCGSRR